MIANPPVSKGVLPYERKVALIGGDRLIHFVEIKEKFPTKTIWLYTGYEWEDICDLPLLSKVDVVVDGKFVEALKSETKHWGGSTNQRVIDVSKTFMLGKIVLYD